MPKEIYKSANKNIGSISPLLYDLQTYFLQIQALSGFEDISQSELDQIATLSKHALSMIDFALVSVDLKQSELPLTNLSASAVAQDVAASLYKLARSYDVDLNIDITKKMEPVYTNEAAAKGILYGLAASLITKAKESTSIKKRPLIVIAAQETTPKTQRLGVYSPNINISPSIINSTNKIVFNARSIAPNDFHHSGLGLVISDNLSKSLGSKLKRFEHRGNKGVGFYVPMSSQLAFV